MSGRRPDMAEMGISLAEQYANKIGLMNSEKVTREDMPAGDTWIEINETGEKLRLEQIENSKDKRVAQSNRLLRETFGPNEVDSLATTEAAMRGVTVGAEGTPDTPLRVHVVENDKKEVIATAQSAVLGVMNEDFEDKQGKKAHAFMLDAYMVVPKGKHEEEIALELYRRRVMDAAKDAANNGQKLTSMVVEATPETSEEFYNKVGMQRLYMVTEEGQLEEVPYFQSVLADAWNKSTGEPNEGQMKSALHLMIGELDGRKELTIEEVLEKVRGIMNYDSYQADDYFESKKALKRSEAILDKDLEDFENALYRARDEKILLMTADERTAWLREHKQEKEITHVPPPEKTK